MTKKQNLQKIEDDILADGVCAELADGATQLVFGNGSVDAEIVFIGEAPGKKEDETGLPFVGAAGKFLNEMLESIGLSREDVYITNIVKYRPPDNRDPSSQEKKAFWPYLVRQLNVIKPKLVVTLGRHSMEYFLPNQKISQIHGQPKRIRVKLPDGVGKQGVNRMEGSREQQTVAVQMSTAKGAAQKATNQRVASDDRVASSARQSSITSLAVLPLYHPAAALYNGGQRQTLMDDFTKIPKVLKQIEL